MFHIKSKWMNEIGTIHITRYRDGQPRVEFSSGEGTTVLSINLSAYGLIAPEGHFFTKDYSEGEGMAEAIEDAGIAQRLCRVKFGPYGTTASLMTMEPKENSLPLPAEVAFRMVVE